MKTRTRVLLSLLSLFVVSAIMTGVYLITNMDYDKTPMDVIDANTKTEAQDEVEEDFYIDAKEDDGNKKNEEDENVVEDKYLLTINYLCKGNKIADSYTQSLAKGEEFTVNSPIITGYTFKSLDKQVVQGKMEETDQTINVLYDANKYLLTVDYVCGEKTLDTTTTEIEFNEEYSADAKTFDGYILNQIKTTESAKMPAEDVKISFVYRARKFNVNYLVFVDGSQEISSSKVVEYDCEYTIENNDIIPAIKKQGYDLTDYNITCDGEISGIMGLENKVVKIYLSSKVYELTINYLNEKNEEMQDSITLSLKRDEEILVSAHTFENYNLITESLSFTMGKGDSTFNVNYDAKEYTATFMNGLLLVGSVSAKYNHEYTIPVYTDIVKSADAENSYVFKGTWNGIEQGSTQVMKGDVTYQPDFESTTNSYLVKWVSYYLDEDELKVSTVEDRYDFGSMPTPPTVVKDFEFEGFEYQFAGWDKVVSPVTCDVVYNATYSKLQLYYSVKFTDENGVVLFSFTKKYGDIITAPDSYTIGITKWVSPEWTINFDGWMGLTEGMTVTGDITFVMMTSKVKNQYSVTWTYTDENGNEESLVVEYYYGELPQFSNKHYTGNATYEYKFLNWDKAITTVVGDVTYIAKYSLIYKNYTITFKDWDGKTISSAIYHYGDDIVFPSIPVRNADGQFTYTFLKWSDTETVVDGDKTYIAEYDYSEISYTIVWEDYDGVELERVNSTTFGGWDKNSVVAERESNGYYTYTFQEWIEKDTEISADGSQVTITYIATYISTEIYYTVTYNYAGNTEYCGRDKGFGWWTAPVISEGYYNETYYYKFESWTETRTESVDGTEVEIVYTATYTESYVTYTEVYYVEYTNGDREESCTNTHRYGEDTVIPQIPTSTMTVEYSYTYEQWEKTETVVDEFGNVTSVYVSVCTVEKRLYQITWSIGEDKYVETYNYGDTPKCPWNTSREDRVVNATITVEFEFTSWNKTVSNVEGDTEYVAMYQCRYTYTYSSTETIGKYTLTCNYTVVVEFAYVEGMDIETQCNNSIDVAITLEFLVTENEIDYSNNFFCEYLWNRYDGVNVNKSCEANHNN